MPETLYYYVVNTDNSSTPSMIAVPTGYGFANNIPTIALTSAALTSSVTNQFATTASTLCGQQIMFLPIGNGALYYHAIPTRPTLTSTSWQTSNQNYAAPIAAPPLRVAIARRSLLRGRRAVRRSIDLFCKFRPAAEVKDFLRGKPLIVRGQHYDYRFRKNHNILRHTMYPDSPHVPYEFHALEKGTGRHLSSGCVVIPGTPVIDQLLALLLHLEDGDGERDVLRNTNWTPTLLLPAVPLPAAVPLRRAA